MKGLVATETKKSDFVPGTDTCFPI